MKSNETNKDKIKAIVALGVGARVEMEEVKEQIDDFIVAPGVGAQVKIHRGLPISSL